MESGLRRLMDLVGTCMGYAWWDGSCLGLRLHRLGDVIDRVAAGPLPAPLPMRAPEARR